MEASRELLLLFLLLIFGSSSLWFASADNPTAGFTQVSFTCAVQKPYDLAVSQRFRYDNGVYDFWVYTSDKSFSPNSPTKPRTELRIEGHDYSTGVWQFEGQFYVASSTTGVSIMQILSANGAVMQLRVINGNLVYYGGDVTVATGIYGRWVTLNTVHDADAGTIKIYIDTSLKYTSQGHYGDNIIHYFKCGVYTQNNASSCMESKWRNLALYTTNSQVQSGHVSGSCVA